MKQLTSIFIFLLISFFALAQDTNISQTKPDTIVATQKLRPAKDSAQTDSLLKKSDSLYKALNTTVTIVTKDSLKKDTAKKDSISQLIIQAPNIKTAAKKGTTLMPGIVKKTAADDVVFYILIFLLLLLGLIKTSFSKYFDSIFTLSFQATFRQTQTREQMAQNVLPAFMLNVLFVCCGGLFITLFASLRHWTNISFWELFVYSTSVLLVIYLIKYLVILFTGWVFNAQEAAGEYRFVVFLINKLLGVIMIPLLFLIAYADVNTKNISVTIVLCLVAFSLAVRYLVSLARIRKNLSITAFHFFIYLCAVEIMPLLIIYKLLFQQTSNR